MQNLFRKAISAASVALLAGGIALAQTSSPSPSPSVSPSPTASAQPAAADAFGGLEAVSYLHHVNQLEIQEASAALGRLQDEQAINYARSLVSDHQANDDRLTNLAGAKGFTLRGFQASDYELSLRAFVDSFSGAQFDQAFVEHQRHAHEEVLAKLQSLAGRVGDAELQALINETIPIIQKHIDEARVSQAAGSLPEAVPPADEDGDGFVDS